MEKGEALSKIEEQLQKIQALADMLIMLGAMDEGEMQLKPATVATLGKMINCYVIRIFEILEEDFEDG